MTGVFFLSFFTRVMLIAKLRKAEVSGNLSSVVWIEWSVVRAGRGAKQGASSSACLALKSGRGESSLWCHLTLLRSRPISGLSYLCKLLGRSALLNPLPVRWCYCLLICLWHWGEQRNTGSLLSPSRSLSPAPSDYFFTLLICRKINLEWSLISSSCFAPWLHSSQFQGASSKKISKCVIHFPRW